MTILDELDEPLGCDLVRSGLRLLPKAKFQGRRLARQGFSPQGSGLLLCLVGTFLVSNSDLLAFDSGFELGE